MENKRYIDIDISVGAGKDIDVVDLILKLGTFIDQVGKDNTFLGKVTYNEGKNTIMSFGLREE